MPQRIIMRGPSGGYNNPPDITVKSVALVNGNNTTNIRPPAGEVWAPTFVRVLNTQNTGAGSTTAYIALVEGSTEARLDSDTKGAGVLLATLTFGSSATGPIRLTNTKYMRIYITTTADTQFYITASVEKVP